MPFKDVEAQPNFVELENKMLSYWEKKNIVQKYLEKNKDSKKKFYFQDGPITANNPMGVHHAWGRTLKDFYQRFYNMMGYEQRFQNGFDCQGLWVEVEVEKELGFKTKKDIEKYGIDKFVNKCKDRVWKYSEIQTNQSKRLGYFMDWDHSYFTMSDENNYMIWHFLKVCHERNWLYEGWDSVPWCPRCGTAISQHEILTEEYKQLTHESVFVKFPILNNKKFEDASLLIWTTTPWTLAANVAVAVHPELKYSLYINKESKEKLIFIDSSETSEMLFLHNYIDVNKFSKEKTFLGEELVSLEYSGPFDELPEVKRAWKQNPHRFHTVFAYKELVNANEGTGLVHMAPGCGKEDYDLSVKEKFAQISPIDSEAKYLKGFGPLSSQSVKEINPLIFTSLKDKGLLYKVQKYKHRYPTCWRCKEELVFRLVEEWYISMDRKDPSDKQNRTLRQEMIDVVKKITWIPDFGLERELDWLNNMHDWLISKKRYWGLALPFWKCERCGEVTVIGSKKELQEKAISGWKEFEGNSPHRPWIDRIKVKCSKCGKISTRILDVGNPWLDAGIVTFSTLVDPKTQEVSYTSDQQYWKKWFPADLVLESFPGQFKNWFYSMIAMSTVLEKTPPYKTLLGYVSVKDEHGEEMHKSKGNAIWFDDAAEKMYSLQPIVQNMKFGYKVADEIRRRFHLMIWNVYKFFITYANLDSWEPKKINPSKLSILDKWILQRLDEVTFKATNYIQKYQAYLAAYEIEQFVQDLSTWYLRRSRKRVGPASVNRDDKDSFYATMHQTLITLMRLLSPFMPFFPDQIYQNLTGKESVHLESWPIVNEDDLHDDLIIKMALVREIVEQGHAVRKEKKIKVRQPLSLVSYITKDKKLSSEFEELLKEELNVKKVKYQKGKGDLVVKLDLKLTEKLRQEGAMREIIRFIQEMRKELKCGFNDRINVYYETEKDLAMIFTKYGKEIKKQVLGIELISGKKQNILSAEKVLNNVKILLSIEICK